jgi:PHD/YefM family antitoxin component YafN of YafNO toxin-antitoxin module
MIVISASETRKWGDITRKAQRETIEVQSHGVATAYIMGPDEYNELQLVKKAYLEEKLRRGSESFERGEVSTATAEDIINQAKERYGL